MLYLQQALSIGNCISLAFWGCTSIAYPDGVLEKGVLRLPSSSTRDEVFPYRVKVEPAAVFAEPLAFKPLIPDMAFVTNKTMWTGHLRQAMREIPEEDYRLVLERAGRGALR